MTALILRVSAAAALMVASATISAQTLPTQPFTFTTNRTGSNVYPTLPAAETAMLATAPSLIFVRESITGRDIRRHYEAGTRADPLHGTFGPDQGNFRTPDGSGPMSGRSWGLGVSVAQAEQNLADASSPSCPPGTPPGMVTPLGEWTDSTRGGSMGQLTATATRLYRYQFDGVPGYGFCNAQDVVVVMEWSRGMSCPASYSPHFTGPTGGAGYCFSGVLGQIVEWNTYHESECEEYVGNPCIPATASKVQTFVDYEGGGLRFVRTWRSRMPSTVQWGGAATSNAGSLPRGWTHSYLRHLVLNGDQPVAYFSEMGAFIPLQVGSTAYLAQDGSGLQVRWSGNNEWRAYFPDGSAEIHRRETAAGCDIVPYLDTVIHPSGASTRVEYDGACHDGDPDRIVGPFGHTLTLIYSPSGTPRVLEAVLDPSGASIDYAYSSQLDRLDRVTYQDSEAELYFYESPHPGQGHLLTSIIDQLGIRYALFDYDAQGRATNTRRADGFFEWSIAYGTGSATATDGNNVSSVYGFQTNIGNGRITGSVGRGGATRSKTNETSGQFRSLTRTDERGALTTYQYDLYRLTSMTEASGTPNARTTTYQYLNETSQLPTLRQSPSACAANPPLSATVVTEYVPGTQLVEERTETGYVSESSGCQPVIRATAFEYGATGSFTRNNGLVSAIRGPRAGIADDVTFTYHECATGGACGQLATITNAAGHVWAFDTYNAHGQATQVTQPNGAVLAYGYDPRQRLETITETASGVPSRTTTYDFYANGLLERVTDPTGAHVEYSYNDARLLTEIRDNSGNRIEYGYDLAGNRTSETIRDPAGTITSSRAMDYDDFNGLDTVSLPRPAGGFDVWDYEFDPTGLLQSVTSPEGRTTSYDDYDALGRLRSFVNALDQRTTYGYDAHDNVVSVTALTTPSYPAGVVTSYVYDDFGRLARETSADRGVLTHSHDEADNLVLTADARGLSTDYVYDALNRLTTIQVEPQGGGVQETLSIVYDDTTLDGRRGQIVSASAQNGSLAYAYGYDAFGRRISEQLSYAGLNAAALTQYTYDAADRIEEIRRGTPAQPNLWVTRNVRDTTGLITDIEDRRSAPVDVIGGVQHAPFGPYLAITFGNARQVSRALDQRYRVSSSNLAAVESQTLTWTPDDNLEATSRTGPGVWPPNLVYAHDALNRTLTANDGYWTGQAYYDFNGDYGRLSQIAVSSSTPPHETVGSRSYTYAPQTNRLTQIQNAAPSGLYPVTSDASGNLTGVAGILTQEHEYDSLSQLRRVYPAGSSGTTTALYDFNPFGERARKQTSNGSVTQVTLYSYLSDGRLLGETIYDNNVLAEQRDYVWMEATPVAMHVTKLDTGGVPTADQVYYLHSDHLGTPRRATNAAGAKVWTVGGDEYFFLGETWVNNYAGGPISPINLRFPGQYFDAETGLNYNYYRTYWPLAGRYMQSDPIGLAGGPNPYLYADGNPLAVTDPLGLQGRYSLLAEAVRTGLTPTAPSQPGAAVSVPYTIRQIQRIDPNYTYTNMTAGSSFNRVDVAAVTNAFARYQQSERFQCSAPGSPEFARIRNGLPGATGPGRIYSARELINRASEPGPFHNFPESYNASVFSGSRTVFSADYVQYTLRGSINGYSGTFEIGVRPSQSGRNEVITHRFFRPDRP